MRVKIRMQEHLDSGVSVKTRIGSLSMDGSVLVLTDCKRTYELLNVKFTDIIGNSFVFKGAVPGVSGTIRAFNDAEWCIEVQMSEGNTGVGINPTTILTALLGTQGRQ